MSRRTRARHISATHIALAALLLLAAPSFAEDPAPQPTPLPWALGGGTAPIGDDLAEIDLTDQYVFLDAEGTKQLMELTQNPATGVEVATIAPAAQDASWFLVFEYEPIGYVPDDEKDQLDADSMLQSIKEGTEQANEERKERGWGTLTIVGWHEAPHYDERTKNLSWAIVGQSEGGQNINRIVKLLGRRGVMTATLVSPPEELASAVPMVDSLLENYRYTAGNTYAEYVPSTDKLAEYGLTALVVGGAGAALVKSGLLAKLWKPIAALFVALGAGLKKLLFSGRKAETSLEGKIG
jgi:uncharacterized membrane-anchored protein